MIAGSYPTYTALVKFGDPLDFALQASDANAGDTLNFIVSPTGGSLTPLQAGFNEVFPMLTVGLSPQTLAFSGTAASIGDLTLTFSVDDSVGGTDLILLTIIIEP